ncbi:MAG: caspase family protein [Bacteroidetes bacterium]|nr:caspase family protein [Bacteroidota bacterium]
MKITSLREVIDVFSIWIKIKSRFCGWALNGKVVYITIFWIFILFGSFQLKAQDKLPNERGPQTGALVIGISKYADKGIDALQYAHEDANQFALYLRSQTGTEIPSKNIYLLTNQQATWSAIYQAMDDIQEKCEAGDLVYFYFWDMAGYRKRKRIFKNGYLLSYNTHGLTISIVLSVLKT